MIKMLSGNKNFSSVRTGVCAYMDTTPLYSNLVFFVICCFYAIAKKCFFFFSYNSIITLQ